MPVPYSATQLHILHQENIVSVTNYLIKNNLSVPNSLTETILLPFNYILKNNIHKPMDYNHPLVRLKRLLHVFGLVVVPADKTKVLTILPSEILQLEMNIHLQDDKTYQIISPEEQAHYEQSQRNTVTKAVLYYKRPNLLNENCSKRYIYFLPKIHKEVSEWRSIYHPKMRPIVSDTNSITHQLAKFVLPVLQDFERSIKSSITSSLSVVESINLLNTKNIINNSTQLVTMDVESLFTRIPQDKLLDILSNILQPRFPDYEKKSHFLEILKSLIMYNTFQVTDKYCLQTIGLPMGGVLSGTLANIYLGYLEREIHSLPAILLYNRFMDDILLISNYSPNSLTNFICHLKSIFRLNITASINRHSVNFLDMTISKQESLIISPYSKKSVHYPIPSLLTKRNFTTNVNIILSQILRTWRLSNHSVNFSSTVNHYLPHLAGHKYLHRIRKRIFKFLLPVKISTHKWAVNIPICIFCLQCISQLNISIKKILLINNKIISIKEPVNCHSRSIHLLVQTAVSSHLIFVPSLHEYLLTTNLSSNIDILPIGKMHDLKLKQFLLKFNTVEYVNKECIVNKRTSSCYAHHFLRHSYDIYGVKTLPKKQTTFGTFFNYFKKVSR